MVFKCIGCGAEWGEGNPEIEGYSHGSCKLCLKDALTHTYRSRQRKQGFHDCFARATKNCSEAKCCYHKLCCTGIE